jgi:hypothetical protein
VKVLGTFLKIFKVKKPVIVAQEWFFHRDIATVHTAAIVKDWFAAHIIQGLKHHSYLLDLAPMDFFLFRKVKDELADLSLNAETIKQAWEGVTRTIAAEDFATAFSS